ncbi:MAG: hypothetical protein EXS14_06865 [Planctomycetes bacterium]|nr:hypothetical protein [Planctomycetota bacterium]
MRDFASIFVAIVLLATLSWAQSCPLQSSAEIRVSAGTLHTLVLQGNGTVLSAGHNDVGQLGLDGALSTFTTFQQISPSILSGVIAVAAGDRHSLALKNDGTVMAWGSNLAGQCGNGNGAVDEFGVSAVAV